MIQTIQIQIGLFYKEAFKGNFEDFSLEIKKAFSTSSAVTLMPIPDSAPDVIPRLSLDTQNYSISAAKNRLDIFLKNTSNLDEIVEKINLINLSNLKVEINRIGFVKYGYKEGKVESIMHLLNDNLQSLSYKDITVRIQRELKLDDYMCNDMEEVGTGGLITDNQKKEGIVILRDINMAEPKALDKEQIKNFINRCQEESNKYVLISE